MAKLTARFKGSLMGGLPKLVTVVLTACVLSACSATDVDESAALNTGSAVLNTGSAVSVPCDAGAADFRNTMQAVINASRRHARMCGARNAPATGSVVWNDNLAAAATSHANDMVAHNFLEHTGSNGLSVEDRAEAAGYDWQAIGENIAGAQDNVAEVHVQWLDSPGHCRNIMNADYTEFGAACVINDNTDYTYYWAVVFGNSR